MESITLTPTLSFSLSLLPPHPPHTVGCDLPLRCITDYTVSLATMPTELRGLESLAQYDYAARKQLILAGDLVPPSNGPVALGAPRHTITFLPLVDWVVEYGPEGSEAQVWAVTPCAWYRLVDPAAKYRGVHTATMASVNLAQKSLHEGQAASALAAATRKIVRISF